MRILQAARELPEPVETYALYVTGDRSHCDAGKPGHAIQISAASAYLNIGEIINIVKKHSIDAVHPGYGFLSESAEFARRMWEEAGAVVIGPGWENLARTGDKIQAKRLAQECIVPVLMAMEQPTSDVTQASEFARHVGFPVMVKAVDGGGGRGIRLIREERDLASSIQRALSESPANSVFVEKAAVDGFHHVEIQIIGDGTGQVRHLWERDCSAQRRFQKVVEYAPSLMQNRGVVASVIESALRMASAVKYRSLGTFEFLVSDTKNEFYFLEVNPRLQVEHTITECVSGIDLVQAQLLLAQGCTLSEIGLAENIRSQQAPPPVFSVQFRLCAEDPRNAFALSIGKVTGFHVPGGHGVRVETSISDNSPMVVGSDFDNLLAKIIITASTWDAVVRKSRRVLQDSHVDGVKTNIALLRGIAGHSDFMSGKIDTQWLERNLQVLLDEGERNTKQSQQDTLSNASMQDVLAASGLPASNTLLRKGDAWSLSLQPLSKDGIKSDADPRHLRLTRVMRNDFPAFLAADIEYTTPGSTQPTQYRMQLSTTTTAAGALVNSHQRRGDPKNPNHVVFPMPGKLMEIVVSEGEQVAENQPLAFIKQMKMELEIRSPRSGRVKWIYEMEGDDEDVAEGTLLAELEPETGTTDKPLREKL